MPPFTQVDHLDPIFSTPRADRRPASYSKYSPNPASKRSTTGKNLHRHRSQSRVDLGGNEYRAEYNHPKANKYRLNRQREDTKNQGLKNDSKRNMQWFREPPVSRDNQRSPASLPSTVSLREITDSISFAPALSSTGNWTRLLDKELAVGSDATTHYLRLDDNDSDLAHELGFYNGAKEKTSITICTIDSSKGACARSRSAVTLTTVH
ncbi:hypothetical protein CPB85DRAFT_1249802 [Mucidula mucida]|nr:hypothetical protein CPB85DRAFT_1249802 [Mucidula mucida]